MHTTFATIDGNEAVARVAYRLSEVIAIYPITPSSAMGEWADAWSASNHPNLWGTVPSVIEMQSEGGAAAAVHGALQTGSLTTTFTSSQGLLLMIPNLYKIAGELTSAVIHVAARALATHALSIFGDHSDVMAARGTGFALLCSASVQEAHNFALIAQAATLAARVPFMHFFDGFRTSHEIQKVQLLEDDDLRSLIDEELILAHRTRALTPDHPVLRGTAQNPDVYFQARERANPYYNACAEIVQQVMDRFGERTGRHYQIYEYYGASDADRVIVLMGSGCETVHETVDYLNARGEKVGVVKVRLYRPFDVQRFVQALPKTTKAIAVLDRSKEPGSAGEPLYLDVVTAIHEAWELHNEIKGQGGQERQGDDENVYTPHTPHTPHTSHISPLPLIPTPKIIAGRYGLSSKEFTPAMVRAIFDNLAQPQPQNHFTVGIHDDITNTSLTFDPNFSTEPDHVVRAMFYGLGSDGTVGANKNSIKIIGEETDNYAQGYFVYDSKKSGSMTVSHLRFGPKPIRSTYLIGKANFIGCHQWVFLDRVDVLKDAVSGATFLLNSPYDADTVWKYLPEKVQQQIISKQLKFYVINATQVARESGMGGRINTIMQVCFFALAGVLPQAEAIAKIKQAVEKTYGKKGAEVVRKNLQAVDRTLENLQKVDVPRWGDGEMGRWGARGPHFVGLGGNGEIGRWGEIENLESAPEFVREVLGKIIRWEGDDLPVSALPADGTFPTGTSQWEKRNIALEIPVWEADICVQCSKCVMVCPHAAIRSKVYPESKLANAPLTFKSIAAKDKDFAGQKFTIQIAPEDCTGCGICVEICPAKNKLQPETKAINMKPQLPLREQERENWNFFLNLPNPDRRQLKLNQIRQQQLQEPLFEFSGACAGCGETPYLKLLSQLFGDRAMIANATGCSSIYGGNLPTTPWTKNSEGRGPAWSNSLFEDNAEFGFGFRLSLDKHAEYAAELLRELGNRDQGLGMGLISEDLVESLLNAPQKTEADIHDQRQRVELLKQRLDELLIDQNNPKSKIQNLKSLADYLVKKSVWIVGGDGWAYDIDFGGLDHVLASGRNVNILVMDTEVYSNTGGQSSKATPRAAIAKFASSGKPAAKKDLGLMAMSYGNVYVASVALGARDDQTLKAFLEAEAYNGPSLIIAYSHCIAHGINMTTAINNQKALVESGRWLLYRYNPELRQQGKNPLQLDMRSPKQSLEASMYQENRFKMLVKSKPELAQRLLQQAQAEVDARWQLYEYLAAQ